MPANLWPELRPEDVAQIDAALSRGNKIEAIKLYRAATHCGLKEAKDAIERSDDANVTAASPRTSGPNWVTIILALLIVAIVLAIILLCMR